MIGYFNVGSSLTSGLIKSIAFYGLLVKQAVTITPARFIYVMLESSDLNRTLVICPREIRFCY